MAGHIVLVVSCHPSLEHYIVPLRRLRPSLAVVIVSPDSAMFYELVHRLAEIKLVHPELETGDQRERYDVPSF